MNSKQNIIIGAAVVVVIIVVGYLIFSGKGPTTSAPQGTKTSQGIVAAPGTSPISETGQVVTQTGQPVKLNTTPMAPEAPQQSNPIASPKDLPPQTIKISVSAAGFSPSSFTAKPGAAITLAVTSADTQTHVFMFDDASLSAVAVGIGPGETRAITFNAPKSGEYTFRCDVPGHKNRGEVGKMIVE
ncbi:MAG: cupredoxin domain-containing protein [Candidatus Liptonbacteria bacterium]|nr:cupredoxin domain-containing protein [Candidatus Liptonbacteria bacterium]